MGRDNPTIKARELGMALERAARAQGYNLSKLADRLDWSHSTVSRLFSGKRGGDPQAVLAVCAACGITGPKKAELIKLAESCRELGWWQEYGDRLPPELTTLSDHEDAAIGIINFQTAIVPGLLQTASYVRALMEVIPAIPANEIPARVEARMRRRQILDRRYPAKFVFFMDEYALARTGAGREIMSEQVHHVLAASVRPHVEIRIILDSAGFHAGRTPFQLMEFTEFAPIVHIEDQTSVLFLERPDTITGYRRIVAGLDKVALDRESSRAWLTDLAAELGAPREEHDEQDPPLEEKFLQ